MPDLITVFQKNVYDATALIPRGKVTTYKLLAQYISCKSSQAVGQALKKNPYAPEIPCHRVVSSNLKLGGYFGEIEGHKITEKAKLLKEEGVSFESENRISKESLFEF